MGLSQIKSIVHHKRMYKVALITGASAGIGKVFAEILSKRGIEKLILVARRLERLEELKAELYNEGFKGELVALSCDLRVDEERVKLKEAVDKKGITVDLLVNNAGFGYVGKFLADEPVNQREMIATNCIAPLHLAQLFLPQMLQSGHGAIINVASIAAYPPLPFMATYGATKAFLLNWSVALNHELKGRGIKVLALCPGPTESDFHLVAGVQNKIDVIKVMNAKPVVIAALDGLEYGRAVVVPGLINQVLVWLTRFLPKSALAWIGEKLLVSRVTLERR